MRPNRKDFLVLFLVLSASSINVLTPFCASATNDQTDQAKTVDWTFLAYVAGDNDLTEWFMKDLEKMMLAGSTSNVSIVVLLDRPGETTKILYVKHGSYDISHDYGRNLNTGDSNTLASFISWSVENHPASRYHLALIDHGGGIKGVCWDYTDNHDCLTLEELEDAFTRGNTHLDVITFYACLMGMTEVAYQISDFADYVVGSEEISWAGWPWDLVLSDLTNNPSMRGDQLAQRIVSHYSHHFSGLTDATIAAVDLRQYDDLAATVDSLAQVLMDGIADFAVYFQNARAKVESYYYPEYVDLYHLAELIGQDSTATNSAIQSAAKRVQEVIRNIVLLEWHNSGNPSSHGLSIYFETSAISYLLHNYDDLSFSRRTRWNEFLKSYLNIPYSDRAVPEVTEAYWSIEGEETIECQAGDTVTLHISLEGGSQSCYGTLVIAVRQDLVLQWDRDYVTFIFSLELQPAELQKFELPWSPKEESDNSLRGYSVEIWFNNQKIWVMEGSYPPRLKVAPQPTSRLEVMEVYWTSEGEKVITCKAGAPVRAHTVVSAQETVSGTLLVKIRKDVAFLPDTDHLQRSYEINMVGGEQDISFSWIPDQPTSTKIRGYFIEVWLGNRKIWSMEPSYPPRLTVEEAPSLLSYLDTTFAGDGKEGRIVEVAVGSHVDVWVKLEASGSKVSGQILVEIRKNIVQMIDETAETLTKEISLDVGEHWINVGTFAAIETTGDTSGAVKDYFIKVKFGGKWIYDPTDPGTRPHVTTYQASALSYLDTRFEGADINGPMIDVPVGTTVDVNIKVRVSGSNIMGTLTVEIRKDLPLGEDKTMETLQKSISLTVGDHWVRVGAFTASEPVNGFRQYFSKVWFDGQLIFDPTDPNARPHVTTHLPGLTMVLVSPSDGTTMYSSPIALRARVVYEGTTVDGATVKFYVDGSFLGVRTSDSNGYADYSYSLPESKVYSWYAIAEKPGYDGGTSPTWSFTYSAPTLSYLDTRFEGAGESGSAIHVPVGISVGVFLKVRVSGSSVSGTLKVEIRKDVPLGPDQVVETLHQSISLPVGDHWVKMGYFTASEAVDGFRQYYNKAWFDDSLIFDPTNPDTRPHVTTYEGTISYSDTKFKGAGKEGRIISVPVGTTIDVLIAVSVAEAPIEGTLIVEVRKDVVLGSDTVLKTFTEAVNLGEGTHWILMGSFTAEEKTGSLPGNVRQYFIRVKWDDQWIFNSSEPDTRPHVTTY